MHSDSTLEGTPWTGILVMSSVEQRPKIKIKRTAELKICLCIWPLVSLTKLRNKEREKERQGERNITEEERKEERNKGERKKR